MPRARVEHERRNFIRLDRIFPVEIQLIDPHNQNILTEWQQAFTDNVSKGGICLIINQPCGIVKGIFEKIQPDFDLKIFIPFNKTPIKAKGQFRWLVKKKLDELDQYIIGVSYKEIHASDNKKIIHYAYLKKLTPIFALGIIAILLASITFSFYFNIKLIKSNLGLAHDLFSILHKSRKAKNTIKEIKKEKDELDLKLSELAIKGKNLNERLQSVSDAKKKEFFEDEIKIVDREIVSIKSRMIDLYFKEAEITEDLLSVEKKQLKITNTDIEGMYKWLESLQDLDSGQIKSLGSGYKDNFLMCQLYSIFGDYDQAQKILEFYFTNNINILNIENQLDLLIAALKYTYITKDNTYLETVKKKLEKIINTELKKPAEPKVELKLYAVLAIYLQLEWNDIFNMHYRVLEQNLKLPVNPDEQFEYLMAFNFRKIDELNISDIITRLEDNFYCTKNYNVKLDPQSYSIKGFIFSTDKNDPSRNFVEDTAKMVLIYKLAAKYFEVRRDIYRSKFYRDKAFVYMDNLSSIVNTNGVYRFMPYVDGIFSDQSSVASTVYTIFAYYNYNPYGLDE
ncbi:MAG: hypothetical protein AB1755_05040 [Candidatus Omnitrophota bacterium]